MYSRIVLVLLVLIVVKTVRVQNAKRRNEREALKRGCLPPTKVLTKGLFGVNTLRQSIKATKEERGVQWISDEMDSVGIGKHTVCASILDYQLFLTRDSENVKAMLASQAQDFDISPHREMLFRNLFGLGVFTARGQDWKHSRGLIRPQFNREQIMNLTLFETHVQALLKRLNIDRRSWSEKLDLSPLFFDFSLDVATDFLIGQSVHNQDPVYRATLSISKDPNGPDLAAFGPDMDAAKLTLNRKGALAKYGWLMWSSDFRGQCKAIQSFVMYFVNQTLSGAKLNNQDQSESEKFVLLHELAKETQNSTELRNEILNVLHAGRDTVASLLGWVFYFLARHEAVWVKLRNEITATFPSQNCKEVTFKKLWDLKYLPHVINETIRYAAVVPMNERTALVDTTLPRGGGPDGSSPIFIPKGTQVLIPTYAMQHRRDVWGDDVEDFRPERWEDRKFGWDFIPFGGGVRQCIGQQFARTECMYTIVRLLQTFDRIENMEMPLQPIRYHHTIENRSGTGVQVRLHAAQ